jgi:hypothetical protein
VRVRLQSVRDRLAIAVEAVAGGAEPLELIVGNWLAGPVYCTVTSADETVG